MKLPTTTQLYYLAPDAEDITGEEKGFSSTTAPLVRKPDSPPSHKICILGSSTDLVGRFVGQTHLAQLPGSPIRRIETIIDAGGVFFGSLSPFAMAKSLAASSPPPLISDVTTSRRPSVASVFVKFKVLPVPTLSSSGFSQFPVRRYVTGREEWP